MTDVIFLKNRWAPHDDSPEARELWGRLYRKVPSSTVLHEANLITYDTKRCVWNIMNHDGSVSQIEDIDRKIDRFRKRVQI